MEKKWDWEIKAETSWWGSSMGELWSFRHLLGGLVRRDFLLGYQQTILGPLWVLLQPIMTMITYVLVFGKVVGISTGTVPPVLFYLGGIVLWTLFNDAFTGTSSVFRDNAQIFSKVYFPRLIVPLAQLSGFMISFGIQFLFFLLMLAYYLIFTDWHPNLAASRLLLVPFIIALVGLLSLALGLMFSVLTGKYRDIKFFVTLGIRLLMFLTPVIYPMQYITEKWRWVVQINPLTPLFEGFRWALLGEGIFTATQMLYSIIFTLSLFLVSLMAFNKQGSKLIDVV